MQAQISLSSTTSFELREALLIYRSDRESAGTRATAFVSRHGVQVDKAGIPRLEPGSPVDQSSVFDLISQLRGSIPIEFLPATVLVRTQESIVWWTRPSRRTMFYAKEKGSEVAELSGKRFPQPSLIFRVEGGGSLDVRAIACTGRPEPGTPLYRAPYWNVNDSGYVCLGSTRVPQQLTVDSLPLWEQAFFESEFTHPNAANRLTLHPGGFVGLWKSLVGKKRFPTEHLAEAKETLSQFIHRSRGV